MANIVKNAVYAGVGLADKLREEIDELVRRGELKRHEGERLLERVTEHDEGERHRFREFGERIEHLFRNAVDRLPIVAIKRDLDVMREAIEEMRAELHELRVAQERLTERESIGAE